MIPTDCANKHAARMRGPNLVLLIAGSLMIALICAPRDASADFRSFWRRQSSDSEKESITTTTLAPITTGKPVEPTTVAMMGPLDGPATEGVQPMPPPPPQAFPPRLYPDLPMRSGYEPGAPAAHPGHFRPPHNQGPSPYNPWMGAISPAGLSPAVGAPAISASSGGGQAERQMLGNSLGRRLLELVGFNGTASGGNSSFAATGSGRSINGVQDMRAALSNSTLLQQLNKGVNSIYGGLSRVYNSTVQQQLGLLQERFRKDSENNTADAWRQTLAQQVPRFFERISNEVSEAQERLNKVWQQMSQQLRAAANGTASLNSRPANQQQQPQTRSFFEQFGFNNMDQFYNEDSPQQAGGFFNQINRSFGWNGADSAQTPQGGGLGEQLRSFWHTRVQPQLGVVRGQMARAWRDLTNSGVLMSGNSEPAMLARSRTFNQQQAANSSEPSRKLMEEILKDVDMSGTEYSIIEGSRAPSGGGSEGRQQQQIQNNLIQAQRELNQLWSGLTSGLQNSLRKLRAMAQGGIDRSSAGPPEVDPSENELDGRLRNLTSLQRDADSVFALVQQQQQMDQQQRSLANRFRNFFNFDAGDQLQARVGDQINRFGSAVGDLWNQIPVRWNNFIENVRQPPPSSEMNQFSDRMTATGNQQNQRPR